MLNFLKMYYHSTNDGEFVKVIISDLLQTILLIGGSGLFTSILRGIYYRSFLNYKSPALIGRRFKIINPKNFAAGYNIWLKDDVSILAAGKIKLGNNCVLCERVAIWSHDKGVKIGDNVAIGIGSYICGTGGSVVIGSEVRIADHVRMYSFNHKYEEVGIPIAKQGYTKKGIEIEDNIWIGSGAVILDGVTIGENSVVAAGAVVTKNVPSNSVVGGVPAKVIKKLTKKK